MRRPLFLLASASLALAGSLVAIACTDNGSSSTPDDTTVDASVVTKKPDASSGGTEDAGADAGPTYCEVVQAYYVGCKQDQNLNCGAKFPAWCVANDQAINSDAFREAEMKCLTQANCDPDRRSDCEYKILGAATLTSAQQQLLTAYCQTCEPSDTAGCATRGKTYDVVTGPKSVTDLQVAIWEFNDAVTNEMRTTCTGSNLDAGADAGDGGCAKAFAGCTADVYLAHLPDCPK